MPFLAKLGGRVSAVLLVPLRLLLGNLVATLLLFTALALIALFVFGLSWLSPDPVGSEIRLDQARSLIRDKDASAAMLRDVDSVIELTTKQGDVWAAYPRSDAYTNSLIAQINRAQIPLSVDSQSGKPYVRGIVQFLLPILILVTLFGFIALLTRDGGGAAFAGFSKWTGKSQKAGTGRVTFKNVAGAPEALVELREICDYLENPARYAQLGAHAPKGVLLTGPPGTGKTLLARAVAGEAAANFFSLSGSEFVESLVGVGAARVRDLFKQARKAAPSIIFIDELDAVGRQRGAGMGQGHDEREQTLNQMLVEMDGFGAEAGVVIMAATNRPDILDNALLRPGRFDRQVVVDLPDYNGRVEILALHAQRAPIEQGVDLARLAHQTPGFSGADLANVINEASLLTVRANKSLITQIELEEAIDRVLSGPARKSHLMSEDELWRIAIHESGHAIVSRAIRNETALQKLSIIARGRGRGGSTIYASSDRMVLSHLDLQRNLVSTMGGAAAESMVFGMLSTGVEDDLRSATDIAHAMVAAYGMSDAVGPVAIGVKQGEVFIGRDLGSMGNVAPETLQLVDVEIRHIVQEGEATARRVLGANADILGQLATALLQHETVAGEALEVYLAGVQAWSEPLVRIEPDDAAAVVTGYRRSSRDGDTRDLHSG